MRSAVSQALRATQSHVPPHPRPFLHRLLLCPLPPQRRLSYMPHWRRSLLHIDEWRRTWRLREVSDWRGSPDSISDARSHPVNTPCALSPTPVPTPGPTLQACAIEEIVINEAADAPPTDDFIELTNRGNATCHLSGYKLDFVTPPQFFTFASDDAVPASTLAPVLG